MFPLLALGILAGNQLFGQYRKKQQEEDIAEKYRGLLGAPASEMGPPEADGTMGRMPGSGLLADPGNIQNQLKFAAGVAGLPGKAGAPGLDLLNAAFGRAQQQAQMQQQGDQFERGFQRQGEQNAQGQSNWMQDYLFRQEEARRQANQFGLSYDLQKEGQRLGQGNADRNYNLSAADFGLRQRAQDRADRIADQKPGPDVPKLQSGYEWKIGADGSAQQVPLKNSDDWRKGVEGLNKLNKAYENVGLLRDMVSGKEVTRNGKKVRVGGSGPEYLGDQASQMNTLYGAIVSDVAAARGMGVLQPGELENIEGQIPNPSSAGSAFRWSGPMDKSYKELQRQIRAQQKNHLRAYPWLAPELPKGFVQEDD